MPVRSLIVAQCERLSGFPPEIPEDELFSYFSLSGADRAVVPERTSPAIRLGFAVSLCAVRYLGFCPEDLRAAPKAVLWYVGDQVGAPADAIERYGAREQTRSDHLRVIYEHLGYRRPTEEDLQSLADWLVERALEHEDQVLLVSLAAEKLKAEKRVRPALYRLERMASSARERGNLARVALHISVPSVEETSLRFPHVASCRFQKSKGSGKLPESTATSARGDRRPKTGGRRPSVAG